MKVKEKKAEWLGRMQESRLNRFSLFYKNTLSTALLILLACVVIGAILLNSAASELRALDEKQLATRIELVIDDLDNQSELMREAALRVSTTALYRPSFRSRSVLDELELVKDIGRYDNYSQLTESCFLLYKGESWVYRSNAKNDFYVCAKALGVSGYEELYRRIDAVTDFETISQEGRIFFICPVFFRDRSAGIPDAYLCFVSGEERVLRRVTDVSGGFDCGWSISADGELLAKSGSGAEDNEPVTAQSEAGFCFELYQDGGRFGYFTLMNAGFVLLIAVALLGVTVLVTYKNYLPLKRIVEKYSDDSGEGVQNELEYIDRLINESHTRQKELGDKIKRQRGVIARQLLTELFKGGRPEKRIVEDIFQFDSFAVLAIRLFGEFSANGVINAVESLSGSEIAFYCVRLEKLDCFACLACFGAGQQLAGAEELVSAALELTGAGYSVGACAVDDISEGVYPALMSALGESAAPEGENAGRRDICEPPDGALLLRITAEIKTGSEQSALACLRRYIDLIFAPGQPTGILCGELASQLMRTANELRLPLGSGRIGITPELAEAGAVYEALAQTVRLLCEGVAEKRRKNRSEQFDRILEYINEHALEYELDQDRVAEHFGISSNSLYRMFKTSLGDNYKHYVTGLRIRAACDYLSAGHSVQEVCGMVGYTNVSYFIKTFKNITGYTPNNYKIQDTEQRA